MKFGVHVSIAGAIEASIKRAQAIGCDTFQIFTRNPRSWKGKELTDATAKNFRERASNSGMEPIIAHMPYLPNIATPKPELWNKSLASLKEELDRCDKLAIPYLVSHLGSPKSAGKKFGISRVISALDKVLEEYSGKVIILLENSAGKEEKLGSKLEDFGEIMAGVQFKKKIGFCFDTCHGFASGYDLRTAEAVEELVLKIDKIIGLKKCFLIHCNDSKFRLGEGRDRHEHIGLGFIGNEGFKNLMRNKSLSKLPFICETPVDERRKDEGNLRHLRELFKELDS